MFLKDISFKSPAENILFDEVLLRLAEEGHSGEALRFWESPAPFIVLGRIGKIKEEIKTIVVEKDKVPVLRRRSGGGTVVQGPGCLNYSLVLSKELNPTLGDLRRSYEFILQRVVNALAELKVACVFRPISDIALERAERKFSGNAQHRGRKFILHHGTLLYNFDLSLIERYLLMPKEIPLYRRQRKHQDFVANLNRPAEDIKEVLQKQWPAQQRMEELTDLERKTLNFLHKIDSSTK